MKKKHWRFNDVNEENIKKQKFDKNDMQIKISRNSKIVATFIGKRFQIHNGKKNVIVTVTEKMLGRKFGEFSFTRANFKFKKK